MLCFKILITANKINNADVSVFLKAGDALDKADAKPKPNADWISEKMWNNILALSIHKFNGDNIAFYKNLPETIQSNVDVWKKWGYEKTDPENFPIPEYEERINNEHEIGTFLKLCLIRSIREDRASTTSY